MASTIVPFHVDQFAAEGPLRVLVVDDHEPWRAVVRRLLNDRCVVGEAKDGCEAVDLAATRQPDVVLLDVGMPGINGMQTALLIRQVAPSAKIVFLSVTGDRALIEHAFQIGAQGYVLKTDACRELAAAIEAVTHNKHFVSSGAEQDLQSQNGVAGLTLIEPGKLRESDSGQSGPRSADRHSLGRYSSSLLFLCGSLKFIYQHAHALLDRHAGRASSV